MERIPPLVPEPGKTKAIRIKGLPPLSVERQVLILFAGTNGYLDRVAESDIAAYEEQLYQFVDVRHGALMARLTELKKLDDELKADVGSALKEFTEQFISTRKGAAA